ncbi:hypothetical protein GGR56DRAFT_509272 [Xylariaceae sp. FL0804]|nr:hypothetical protein GGR56DRAFT_509272 [Xylariaceae sp. FL0804]
MSAGLPFLKAALPRVSRGAHVRGRLNGLYRTVAGATNAPASISALLAIDVDAPLKDIKVDGYVRSVRIMKKQSFVSLGDGSSAQIVQAVVPAEQADGLAVGAAVRFCGSWQPSPGHGQEHELKVHQTHILGTSVKTYPIQNKYQTPEYLRTVPHMRPRLSFNATVLRFRSQLISSLTGFFEGRGLIQTHPPILTSSDCEGAGEAFNVSSRSNPPASEGETARPFFRRPVYTTVSTQLHLEALSQSLGSVWTLSPTFRAEHSDTPRHLSEFYMLEAELSFVDELTAVMDLVEDMLRHVAQHLMASTTVLELLVTHRRSPDLAPAEIVRQRWEGLKHQPWPRITYTEAIKILRNSAAQFDHKPEWGKDLHTEHEKYIAKTVGGDSHTPVFVTNYPRDIKAFYMKADDSAAAASAPGTTVECFDLLVPELCELAGGSMREHRLKDLLESMRAHGIHTGSSSSSPPSSTAEQPHAAMNNLDWYADLRRWGCPPHGGFGLGFDRLISYLSGVQTIHDTAAFPRWYGRCDC